MPPVPKTGLMVKDFQPLYVDFQIKDMMPHMSSIIYLRRFKLRIDGQYIVHVVTPLGTTVLTAETKPGFERIMDEGAAILRSLKIEVA